MLAPVKDCSSDIVFVLDDSRSIGSSNFARIKSFLSQLVTRLDIDSGMTSVGVVTYSSAVRTRYYLNYYNSVAAVQSAISRLTYSAGSTNNMANALSYVRRYVLTSARGDRSNAPNIVVLLTTGRSTNTSATQVCIMLIMLQKNFTFQ